ncbi:MAG: DUF3810 family protein [Vicinamibacterales bacterium]
MSQRTTFIVGAVAIAAALAAALMPLSPVLVERAFSTGAYPVVQRVVTSVSNLLPFAAFDILLVAVVATAVFALQRGVVASFKTRHVAPLARVLFAFASGGALAYIVFLGLWGLNYRRVPMLSRLDVVASVAGTDAVRSLGLDAVRRLNELHAEAHRIGWAEPEWSNATLTASAAQVQRELTGVRAAVPGRLKDTALGPWFRWNGVDGMVNPFGLEVLENPDLLPFERPFVAAHEWAHLAGFASEAEASFVGFLTCVRGGIPDQYSGWLYLYWQVAGETDAQTRRQLSDALAPGPRADVQAIIARLRAGELPALRLASWRAYDTYLKANRVESGVRSYGEVVNLLVRARFNPGWVPVRRAAR